MDVRVISMYAPTHAGTARATVGMVYNICATCIRVSPSVLWCGRGSGPAIDGPAPKPGVCAGVIARIAPEHAH